MNHIPGVTNPADLFTKILSKQEFEKHRKVVLNLPGDTGVEHARRDGGAVGRCRTERSFPAGRDGRDVNSRTTGVVGVDLAPS